jgi:multiple antibiotic resistance protein
MDSAVTNFLLALSALFSIVNPIGAALIFHQITEDLTHAERSVLARRIAIYSAIVMLGALWGGTYILNFFGVSLSALRISGGLVVASRAWTLLQAPERHERRKQKQASQAEGEEDVAFFPLTIPFTTGPGTISVAIALGSNLPLGEAKIGSYFIGASAAALIVAVLVWISYRSTDNVFAILGTARARVLTRLTAFLLLCVGTQIMLNGLSDYITAFLRAAGHR